MKVIGGHIYSNGTRWSAETPSGEVADFALFSSAQFWLDMDRYLSTPSTNSPRGGKVDTSDLKSEDDSHVGSSPIEGTNFLGETEDGLQEGFDGFQEREESGHPRLGVAAITYRIPAGEEFGAPALGTTEILSPDSEIHYQNPSL